MVIICLDCGCLRVSEDHGDERHLTLAGLAAAAGASGITLTQAAENILAAVYTALAAPEPVAKDAEPRKFCLGIAYTAGVNPRIAKGLDGARDVFSEAELELACHSFMLSGQQHGMFHVDGTEGAARPVENYIYRNPIPWVVAPDLIVRKGDWVLGALLEDKPWELVRAGKVNGWSIQGVARRRPIRGDL